MEAQKAVETRSAHLRKCRNNQYYEYQTWVIRKGELAFQRFMGYRFGLSEGDAQKIFLLVDAYFTKFNPTVKVRGNDGTYGAPYITAADERRQDYTAPNASPAMM